MTYNPNIPQGQPSPKNQTSAVQTNFAQFAALFSTTSGGITYNHTALNNNNQGDHESILLTLQSVDPGVTEDLDVIYCKNASSAVGTQPQLFLQIPVFLPTSLDPSTPGNPPMQLTYNSVNKTGPVYQSFLTGGYILYFGSVTFSSPTVTLSPVPSAILMGIAIPNNLTVLGTPISNTVGFKPISSSQFQIVSSTAAPTDTFKWMVIAKP